MAVIDASAKFPERVARVPEGVLAQDRAHVRDVPALERRELAALAAFDPYHPSPAGARAAAAALGLIGMSEQVAREQVLWTALSRIVAAFLDGAEDPVSAGLDVLAGADLELRLWELVGRARTGEPAGAAR